jgi:Nif-specific regulatory protein
MSGLPEIKGYRILEKTGTGGLASVYKACDSDQGIVAVKVLLSQDPEDIERFRKEYLLLAGINHPNIVRVYDSGLASASEPYFSMEYIAGQNLTAFLHKSDLQTFYSILLQVLQTLEFLHTKGIIHTDIKPSNVLVLEGSHPEVKFTDFGFAEHGRLTVFSQWKGTIPYLAPEIIRGEGYNHQADLYSLGVVLYQALTGKLPFEETDLMELAKAHLEKEPKFPDQPEIPEALKKVVLRLLLKDPIDRYYSAVEVMGDLSKFVDFSTKANDILLGRSLMTSTGFIGRESELVSLKEAFRRAESGKTEIVLLKGGFGIGKTRLLKEFKIFVQQHNGTVIWRNSLEMEQAALSDVHELLQNASYLVLIIDDFQNVSLEGTELLFRSAEQIKDKGVLICLAVEDDFMFSEKDQRTSRLESNLESLLKGNLTKILLQPLDKDDSSRSVNTMMNWRHGVEKIGELVYQKTGGNPFLVLYSLTSLLENGHLTRVNDCWEINPDGFEKIILPGPFSLRLGESLKRLGPESLNLLNAAAVMGTEPAFYLIPEISGCSTQKAKECAEELFKERILRTEVDSTGEKLVFINGMAKDFVYTQIGEENRKLLHRVVGKALESHYSHKLEEIIDDLARHFVEAGDESLAFKYSLAAGQKADRENNHKKAIMHYLNAAKFWGGNLGFEVPSRDKILERLGKLHSITGNLDKALGYYSEAIKISKQEEQSPDRIAKLCQEMGVLYLRKGKYEKAVEILNEGLSLCRKPLLARLSAELNTTLGWVYQRRSDYPEAISRFQRSIELLEKENSKELGLALNGLGVVYWTLGEFDKTLNCYHKSLKIFEELKEENSLATVHINLGLLSRSRDGSLEALDYFEKALCVKQKYGETADLSFLYNNIALTYENLYEWDKSLEYHLKSIELKEKMCDQNGLAVSFSNLGLVHLRRGALGKSLEYHLKALKLFRYLNDRPGIAHSCSSLGEVYLLREEWLESKTYLERSLRLRQESNDASGIADTLGLLGRLNLEIGDFSAASSQLQESLKLYDNLKNQKKMLELTLFLTELGLKQDDQTGAEAHLNHAEKLLDSVGDRALKGKFKRINGALWKRKGKVEECLREFSEAIKIFKTLKMRYELGMTYLEVGRIKCNQGTFREAKGYLNEALAIFRDLEIPKKILECEALLKELTNLTRVDLQRTQVLYQLSELLNNITDIDELLVKILDLAIEHLSAERAAVILYYPQNDSLELKAARGIETDTREDALNISRRIIKDVLKADAPLIIEDTRNDPEISSYKSVITHNILSILCVPLVTNDRTFGTIYVDHRSLSGIFSKEDLDFLKAFANLIAVALEKAKLYGELHEEIFQLKKGLRKTYSHPNIVGRSKKMQEVFQMVEKVASTKTSILLLGESGTGKELIANLIHHTGVRKDKPFVKVNCAALPESILESELFGVEEKVATGVAMRDGKFKQADGGTIFFDEIGDMSLSTQAKVLRVLQEREFERVGGSRTIKVDIRVISATNKDLDKCIDKGAFRKDLFYRLNPVTIKIPPLRERREDIPYLIEYFLEKFSLENKKSKPAIPVRVMNFLVDYPWSGNVRELANLMERAVLFSENGSFPKEYLPTKEQIQRDIKLLSPKDDLTRVLNNVEKEMLLQALENNSWNQVKAASQLGISEATLRRKMLKHKLKRPEKRDRQK